ncbi:MAG: hypothetical protein A2X04_06100 [Bacteroidetes bacterium GWF2_41_9]|nr:MAG: hypothetical protein A2X04_06100 [Bacteroidetes bacterium GWF2_41_9]
MNIANTYKPDGSYKLESFTENMESEITRLKFQVDLFYRKEFALYRKMGLKDGMMIVECGSGPGFLLANIVRDLPDCIATAVEIDPHLVEQLTKNASENGRKLFEVINASIYDTHLPDNYFDFAIARLVLEHLKNPEKAITEVIRILKPGGRFVIVSNDFAYHLITHPPIAELDKMYNAYIESRFSEGGNPLIARQLPALLKNGNFENIDIEVICVHSGMEGDKPFLKAENVNISKSLVREGFLKKEVLESLIESWYKMLQHPDHAIFRQLFVVSGEKSTTKGIRNHNPREEKFTISDSRSMVPDNLEGMTTTQQESALRIFFINKVREIIENKDLDPDPDAKLNDIDIDSIAAAELSSLVKSDFNTVVSISDILQNSSISDIIRNILSNPESFKSLTSDRLVNKTDSNLLEGEL